MEANKELVQNLKDNSIYRWVKATPETLPPLNEDVIIDDGETVYKDRTSVGWDKRITDYRWLCKVEEDNRVWEGLCDSFYESRLAHDYKDGKIDFRLIASWFKKQALNYTLIKKA